jgi:hypothetical protein
MLNDCQVDTTGCARVTYHVQSARHVYLFRYRINLQLLQTGCLVASTRAFRQMISAAARRPIRNPRRSIFLSGGILQRIL